MCIRDRVCTTSIGNIKDDDSLILLSLIVSISMPARNVSKKACDVMGALSDKRIGLIKRCACWLPKCASKHTEHGDGEDEKNCGHQGDAGDDGYGGDDSKMNPHERC